jgi:hypothetical protein
MHNKNGEVAVTQTLQACKRKSAQSIRTFVYMTAAPEFLFESSTNRMQHYETGMCIEFSLQGTHAMR